MGATQELQTEQVEIPNMPSCLMQVCVMTVNESGNPTIMPKAQRGSQHGCIIVQNGNAGAAGQGNDNQGDNNGDAGDDLDQAEGDGDADDDLDQAEGDGAAGN